ncbi:hypothetical protein GCM10023231_03590 [Olivibacter ginsenosidimutans]|uniref:Secretory protein n=1 Tax=Olivibacter ginsenosidimutans TaxID=1176537 RepID=A0ABP9AEX7_9SPHI
MTNKLLQTIFFSSALFFSTTICYGQDHWGDVSRDKQEAIAVDTISKGKYTLVFINKSASFDDGVKNRLIDVFFINYPKEAKLYNKKTRREVTFVIDPAYQGVAAAAHGIIRFNPEWFKKNPNDIDVVTHEVMHLVQAYPNDSGPGWITEGIADYVRFTLGVDNEGAHWKLPDFDEKQSYENAYRVTARFFYWIELHVKKGLLKKLDNAMRTKTYTDDFWKKNTGKSVDELWSAYARNPNIG